MQPKKLHVSTRPRWAYEGLTKALSSGRLRRLSLLHILPLVVSVIIGGTLAYYSGQDLNYDLRNYHYYNPAALLKDYHERDFAPAQLQTYLNPTLDILPYALIKKLSPVAVGVVLGGIQGINIWLVYEILVITVRMVRKTVTSIHRLVMYVVVATSFLGAASLTEVGGTMGDNLASIPFFAGVLLILYAFQNQQKQSWQIRALAYVLIGLSVGLKMTMVPFAVGVFGASLLEGGTTKKRIFGIATNAVAAATGFLASYGYWGAYLWQTFKSPMFPFFNTIFRSPYYYPSSFFDPRFLPEGLLQTVFYPFYFLTPQLHVSEIAMADWRLAILYTTLVGLVAFVLLRWRTIPRQTKGLIGAILVFVVVSYIVWGKLNSIYRYMFVLEVLSMPVLYFALVLWLPRLYVRAAVITVAGIILLATTHPMNYGRIPWQEEYFGIGLPAEIINETSLAVVTPGNEPTSYFVHALPTSARIIQLKSQLVDDHGNEDPDFVSLRRQKIEQAKHEDRQFFALYSEDDENVERTLSYYNFKTNECKSVPTHYSVLYLEKPDYYKICRVSW